MSNSNSRSTRAKPSKAFNWLFFDSAHNTKSGVEPMRIDGYSQDARLRELPWAANLKRFFKFRAGILIEFWQVGYQPKSLSLSVSDPFLLPKEPLSMEYVKRDWISTAGTIYGVAEFCHSANTGREALGESWDIDEVHFLITAEEAEGNEDPAASPEKGYRVRIAVANIELSKPEPLLPQIYRHIFRVFIAFVVN